MTNAPKTVSANDVIDMLVDMLQDSKNFVVKNGNKVIDVGQGGLGEVNNLLDQAIDKLQDLKG